MEIVPFLPSIIVLLLIISTVTLFIFWLGQPSKRKLKMAQLALSYLFFLNALLAITTNVMIYKDPASVEKSPLSLLMMLLPLGVGVLLYRAGCKRQSEIPEGTGDRQGAPAPRSRAERSYKTKPGKANKQGQWQVIDKNTPSQAGESPSVTWVMVLFLISALAYAPAMFMLDSKEEAAVSSQPASDVKSPNSATATLPVEPLKRPAPPAETVQEPESQTAQ